MLMSRTNPTPDLPEMVPMDLVPGTVLIGLVHDSDEFNIYWNKYSEPVMRTTIIENSYVSALKSKGSHL